MDAGGAAKAFDADTGGGFIRPAPVLRVITDTPVEVPVGSPAEQPGPFQLHNRSGEALRGFGASRRLNWPAIGLIGGLHAALLVGLVTMDVVNLNLQTAAPMLVDLVPAAPPPSPPEPVFEPQLEVIPPVIVPPTLDILPPRESPIQAVVAETPPPASPPVAVAAPAPVAPVARPSASAAVADLSTTMVAVTPPQYPLASRRLKEEGTVVLLLTVGPDGKVADIRVSRSSGHERLDTAALSAVKKWRWAPTLRGGQPVQVQGFVEIPFVLKKS